MTYAIIRVGGKQYRVREGQRLLVDRLREDEGATFSPSVLLVGGDGSPALAPEDVTVTARVLGATRGPKLRIGKYKKRTGYRRHTGFRAALTQIEIESIGTARESTRKKPKTSAKAKAQPEQTAAAPEAPSAIPEGYDGLTIAEIKKQAGAWDRDALEAALVFEQANAQRKGAIAVLESALAEKEDEA